MESETYAGLMSHGRHLARQSDTATQEETLAIARLDELLQLLFARPVDAMAWLNPRSGVQFRQGFVVTAEIHEASGKIVVIAGAGLKPHGLAEFGFRSPEILSFKKGCAEKVVGQGGIRIQFNCGAQLAHCLFLMVKD